MVFSYVKKTKQSKVIFERRREEKRREEKRREKKRGEERRGEERRGEEIRLGQVRLGLIFDLQVLLPCQIGDVGRI